MKKNRSKILSLSIQADELLSQASPETQARWADELPVESSRTAQRRGWKRRSLRGDLGR